MFGPAWYEVSQQDPRVVALYARHYSSKKNGKRTADWLANGIAGPGETMTLLTPCGRAMFLWRRVLLRDDEQTGIECSVFRNEGAGISSQLIDEASALAIARWNERLFTYVDPVSVESPNPGYCFKKAGWSYCGKSKVRGLHILEFKGGTR